MIYRRFLLFVLLVCVCCFALPSRLSYAVDTDDIDTNYEYDEFDGISVIDNIDNSGLSCYVSHTHGTALYTDMSSGLNISSVCSDGDSCSSTYHYFAFRFYNTDKSLIASKGDNIDIDLSNFFACIYQYGELLGSLDVDTMYSVMLTTYENRGYSTNYSLGESEMIVNTTIKISDYVEEQYSTLYSLLDFEYEIIDSAINVGMIEIRFAYYPEVVCSDYNEFYEFENIYGFGLISFNVDDNADVVNAIKESNTLLGAIKDGISNVFNTLVDGFNNVVDGLTNIVNSIIELPGKLWALIEEGLIYLFVPSEEDITEVKEDWENLLSESLGGIYEAGEIVLDFYNSFSSGGNTDTVEFPSVSLSLAGSDFSFGGYDVALVPDGFSFIIDFFRLLVNMLATIYVINAMRRKFNRVVGDET